MPRKPGPKSATQGQGQEKLTERQRRILQVIRDAVVLRGYPPSIREIGDAAGLQSTSSVAYQLKELERKGYLRRDPNKPRAVDLRTLPNDNIPKVGPKPKKKLQSVPPLEEASTSQYVPLVGSIAAGSPILAEENVSTYYPLPEEFTGDGDLFMLEVVGESMRDAGILNGDYVVIRSQKVAEQGEFVAAMIDNEATVKEFFKDSTGIWLLPHNDAFDPIAVTPDTEILGKVVSVLRKL
ncbi:MAG: transcriptional repressor LexA [Corynebacterium sp.]|uniref:transcriptional repressor LexA n=1 Tax=Corynebacterium sp. TaxID=1720 RepID=UPI0026DC73D9|nr:transcriptional repressor LexA [Corynebacterium sp.]MDO4760722.1 transcriptional repressor LexA [Corynebacterium sp.]